MLSTPVSQAGSYPSATCQPVIAHWLPIYAPGETQALYVNQCWDWEQAVPVVPVVQATRSGAFRAGPVTTSM